MDVTEIRYASLLTDVESTEVVLLYSLFRPFDTFVSEPYRAPEAPLHILPSLSR